MKQLENKKTKLMIEISSLEVFRSIILSFSNFSDNYGIGMYFHTSPDRCMKYCTLGKDKTRSIYLVRALIGKVGQGAQNLVEPPLVEEGSTEYYDSVADDINSPMTHVFFDRSQVYPEYLITFKDC